MLAWHACGVSSQPLPLPATSVLPLTGVGEDRRVLSKSAQYRRLLKMYGGTGDGSASTQQQAEATLTVGTPEGLTQEQEQGRQQAGLANDGCQMCQFVVQYLKIAIANNETMAQVGAAWCWWTAGGVVGSQGALPCSVGEPPQLPHSNHARHNTLHIIHNLHRA